jgi:hypothetical protein
MYHDVILHGSCGPPGKELVAGAWRSDEEYHPLCIAEKILPCDVGVVAADACWDSGPMPDGKGLGFVLYRMPAETFARGAAGAQKYQQICEAVELHTFYVYPHHSSDYKNSGFEDMYNAVEGPYDEADAGWDQTGSDAGFIPAYIG